MSENEEPRPPKPLVAHQVGADLSAVSADELRDRITLLEGEIERLRDEERRKVASREVARAFFRS